MTAAADITTIRDALEANIDYCGTDPNDLDGEQWGPPADALAALTRVEHALDALSAAVAAAEAERDEALRTQTDRYYMAEERAVAAERENERLTQALAEALRQLGELDKGYPAVVVNASEILRAAQKKYDRDVRTAMGAAERFRDQGVKDEAALRETRQALTEALAFHRPKAMDQCNCSMCWAVRRALAAARDGT